MALALRILARFRLETRHGLACRRRFLSVGSSRYGPVIPYKLTDIGEGIRDVTIKEWFVKPGDRVSQFEEICEVQSDKASVTITSRYDGVIKTLRYEVNEVALVGDPLVDIEVDDEVGQQESAAGTKEAVRAEERAKDLEEKSGEVKTINKFLATPAVRRIATENNIDLGEVEATGKDGRVLKEDVLRYLFKRQLDGNESKTESAEKPTEKPLTVKTLPVKRYAKHMWTTMTRSLTIPHFVYSDECDVTKILRVRTEAKDVLQKQDIPLSLTPFFLKAASKALEQFPELNGWLDEESQSVRVVEQHNISVAMDTPEGLVVPNIKNVQKLSVAEVARELKRLRDLGRKAALTPQDLTGGTFTLSNIGVAGGTYTKPVILSPQIVIGAVGKVQRLPRFDEDNNVVPADILSVSWAADHRVVDGVTMANYSNLWKHYVENPMHLLLG